ncbi:MAG: protoheme IX farnesyltransferase, partial [Planctomycetaceae bacterium]|nr:protoheme IX farnesyltransferase [Planctomycetaceae bacterium]
GLAGDAYFCIALALGVVYLLASVRFFENETRSTARRLLLTSLIYLPALLVGLTIDHWRLLS